MPTVLKRTVGIKGKRGTKPEVGVRRYENC
jgi:hypothetical protein